MPRTTLTDIRHRIREAYLTDEKLLSKQLITELGMSEKTREKITADAAEFVRSLRRDTNPGLMETFLGEYGLSTEEGIALMCLAEALLRVPDEQTIDMLIQDKIAPADWSRHLGHSTSPLVNVSTWALMLTGKVITPEQGRNWDVVGNIRNLVRRAGEPVIRKAVGQAMRVLGHQFVLGRDIREAQNRASAMEKKGYTYSYDMLGEGARTAKDAKKYFLAYSRAISSISESSNSDDVRENPGISIKLSALHPRYEFAQKDRVMQELVPRVVSLAIQAKNAGMGFNIDAEEADRLDLSLDVIEAVLATSDLKGWDGFGVVIQAYGLRASHVIDWCYGLATELDRKIMIRLVKGAYWDTEIKLAQEQGLDRYPVFTHKAATDVSYMACARKLLSMTDRIYPQFATHNAHSVISIMEMAPNTDVFEFQRLHGMGESLHDLAREKFQSRCRIYAPVGVHEDLLAYLVRRLLENGANSSFVNQVFDEQVPARQVVRDPIEILENSSYWSGKGGLPLPHEIYPDGRMNSKGLNFANPPVLAAFDQEMATRRLNTWDAAAIIDGVVSTGEGTPVINPANRTDQVGTVLEATPDEVQKAFDLAKEGAAEWQNTAPQDRAGILRKIADLYEARAYDLMAILAREAGKTPWDALNEIREAVDFCRYYAEEAAKAGGDMLPARGVIVCISPWNFPLAIFTGQIVAALVAGNAVLAKPAGQTPLIAFEAVQLMLEAGIPSNVLALLPGEGSTVGQALVSNPDVGGVCFTGSTATAQHINRTLAENAAPTVPLIAETGGLNAMIVDSTALPEQAVDDIVTSAFQSAGQRCSALRILYVQEDIADTLIEMMKGAVDELSIGNPQFITTDVGPVIDKAAYEKITSYIDTHEAEGKLLYRLALPKNEVSDGYFVTPAAISVSGISEMAEEIFGPVLHVATYKASELEQVVEDINAAGYGLTMGLHTRVDSRVQKVAELAKVGNLYVNRNQIGAVVQAQPFGGEGLSGTGPKAGGPLYLKKFGAMPAEGSEENSISFAADGTDLTPLIDKLNKMSGHITNGELLDQVLEVSAKESAELLTDVKERLSSFMTDGIDGPGPTGESNRLDFHGRGLIWVHGANWQSDMLTLLATGNKVIVSGVSEQDVNAFKNHLLGKQLSERVVFSTEAVFSMDHLKSPDLSACCLSGQSISLLKEIRVALSHRTGVLVPCLASARAWPEYVSEKTLSVDTTASGGNAALLASVPYEN
ncbi:bifunctional proline dehydrogenase/L-glutamate gamma-semialdehyde dehydrogenase PutA [Sneathiella sp. P13V-1]|nr:bifunctional proline dehydrogenase/L-glutamate gamma-semialdehyde dehydrogenase PutA [Sneathiella sp. P13V-1]